MPGISGPKISASVALTATHVEPSRRDFLYVTTAATAMKCRLANIAKGTCFGATMLLVVTLARAEKQPSFHQSSVLWKLAQRACSGNISHDPHFADAIGLDHRHRFFFEPDKPENLAIADRDCLQQAGHVDAARVVLVIGHNAKDGGYFYRIMTQSEEIIDAAFCPDRAKCRAIKPIRPEGGSKVYTDNVQKDFRATLQRVIENWGR